MPFDSRVKIPSKVFLLGEYVALVGRPVLVVGVEPCFEVELGQDTSTAEGFVEMNCHPDSPARRYRSEDSSTIFWKDPHQGSGGFGGSTAEFLAVQLEKDRPSGRLTEWQKVYRNYREFTARGALPPSGIDLVAQMLGGIHLLDGTHLVATPLFPKGSKLCLLFSAAHLPGRKVKTHEHLSALAETWNPKSLVPLLELPLKAGTDALGASGFGAMGPFATEYADVLWNAGLESPAAHADREALESLPAIAGVKGTGALLSDAVLVIMDELHSPDDRSRVIETAEARGLKLVLDGLKPVRGPWFDSIGGQVGGQSGGQ